MLNIAADIQETVSSRELLSKGVGTGLVYAWIFREFSQQSRTN